MQELELIVSHMERGTQLLRACADQGRAPDLAQLMRAVEGSGCSALDRLVAACVALAQPMRAPGTRDYFDYATNGIIDAGSDGFVTKANSAAASILRLPLRRLQQLSLDQLFDGEAARRHFALLAEQGICRSELRLINTDLRIDLSSVDIGDGRMLHVFDDVTAERELVEAIERARAAADSANRAKSVFLANMSHEIRTPLNGVIGLAELLQRTQMSESQRTYLEQLLASSHGLMALLNDLLDVAMIESGRLRVEMRAFELAQLVREQDGLFGALAAGKGLGWSITVEPGTPPFLLGDALRVGQVLRNLLSNALKFTEHGSIALRIGVRSGAQLGAPLGAAQDWLALSVRDTGIGISDEHVQSLFVPFAQADASITRRFGGTGLGLAISRMLAEAMGGTVSVHSVAGCGSVFTLSLPLAACEAPLSRPMDDFGLAPGQFSGARVLVAEDYPINQAVIEGLLGHAGVQVVMVGNGALALDAIERSTAHGQQRYDLVLMDVQMPELDGLEATRLLRSRGCTLPILALTAGVSDAETGACIAAGMNGVVTKPIGPALLAAALARWLPDLQARHADAHVEHVPGIDLADALPRFLERRDVLLRARDQFLLQHGACAGQLAALVSQGQWEQAARLTHEIRAGAGNIGARVLSGCALRIEQLLRERDGAHLPALLARVQAQMHLLGGGADAPASQ